MHRPGCRRRLPTVLTADTANAQGVLPRPTDDGLSFLNRTITDHDVAPLSAQRLKLCFHNRHLVICEYDVDSVKRNRDAPSLGHVLSHGFLNAYYTCHCW